MLQEENCMILLVVDTQKGCFNEEKNENFLRDFFKIENNIKFI